MQSEGILTSSGPNRFFLADLFGDKPVVIPLVVTKAGSGSSKVLLESTGGEVIAVTFENAAAWGVSVHAASAAVLL